MTGAVALQARGGRSGKAMVVTTKPGRGVILKLSGMKTASLNGATEQRAEEQDIGQHWSCMLA